MNRTAALALALASFAAGAYLATHWDPAPAGDDPRTLARVGLLAFENGDEATAEQVLSRALELGVDDEGVTWVLDQLRERRAAAEERARTGRSRAEVARAEEAAATAELHKLSAELRRKRAETALNTAAASAAAAMARAEVHAGGGCWIDLKGSSKRSLRIAVTVGGEALDLIYDTGATVTLVTREAAERLGVDWESAKTSRASTPGGIIEAPFVDLGDVEIVGAPGLTRQAKRVGVCDDCMHFGGDGLFGMDLQSAFEMDLDLQGGRVRIPECQP